MNDILNLILTLILGNFFILFGAYCLHSDKPVLKLFGVFQWTVVACFMFFQFDLATFF